MATATSRLHTAFCGRRRCLELQKRIYGRAGAGCREGLWTPMHRCSTMCLRSTNSLIINNVLRIMSLMLKVS